MSKSYNVVEACASFMLAPMAYSLPRAYRRQLQAADEAKVERIVREAGGDEPARFSGGDVWRRREASTGVPAIGRGVAGAIRGTRPGDSLFRS